MDYVTVQMSGKRPSNHGIFGPGWLPLSVGESRDGGDVAFPFIALETQTADTSRPPDHSHSFLADSQERQGESGRGGWVREGGEPGGEEKAAKGRQAWTAIPVRYFALPERTEDWSSRETATIRRWVHVDESGSIYET